MLVGRKTIRNFPSVIIPRRSIGVSVTSKYQVVSAEQQMYLKKEGLQRYLILFDLDEISVADCLSFSRATNVLEQRMLEISTIGASQEVGY